MIQERTYLSNLNSIRGIAALLTVLFHVDGMIGGGGMLFPFNTGIMTRMYLMVDLFFILSGFVILHVYGPWFANRVSWLEFKRFVLARFARIYPLHALMLLVMMGLLGVTSWLGMKEEPALEIRNDWFSVITNLLLIHSMNVHDWFTWVHASWSISTEWWMYMVFPFLAMYFVRIKPTGRILLMVGAFGGYWLITFVLFPMVTFPPELERFVPKASDLVINVGFQYGFVRCAIGFMMGMVVYQWFKSDFMRQFFANGYTLISLVIFVLLSFHFNLPDAVSVMILPFIILSAAYGSEKMDGFFSLKPMQRLGDWSYSIYLVHQPLIILLYILVWLASPQPGADETFLKPPVGIGWALAVIVTGVTLLLASQLYRWWEKPMRKLLNPGYQEFNQTKTS